MLNKITFPIYNRLFKWVTYREIRNKILITVAILIVFRFLANIPIPGVDPSALKNAFSGAKGIFDSLDVLSGGTLSRFSIISLGLSAYINASFIFQLLGTVIKRLEDLQKEGESGRAKINQWTRILAVPLAALQAVGIYNLLKSNNLISSDLSNIQVASIAFVATAGAILLMWLGELINEQGLGNGISLIIMAGIVVKLPGEILQLFTSGNFTGPRDYIVFGTIMALVVGLICLIILLYRLTRYIKPKIPRIVSYILLTIITIIVVGSLLVENVVIDKITVPWLHDAFKYLNTIITKTNAIPALIILAVGIIIVLITAFNEATRKIPIQFARRFKSSKAVVLNNSYIPFRLLISGVAPIIFASSFLYLPAILYFFFNNSTIPWLKDLVVKLNGFVVSTRWEYWLTYFVLIFLFTYFYTLTVAFRPKVIAENQRKQGSFIPGVRPGYETEVFLTKLVVRLTFFTALFIGTISILPFLLNNVPGLAGVFTSGTSSLIVVSVILDLRRQIAALQASQNYSKFIEN